MKYHIRSKVAFKHFLGRFPSNSQITQCLPKEIPPCANKGSLMKILSLTRKYCKLRFLCAGCKCATNFRINCDYDCRIFERTQSKQALTHGQSDQLKVIRFT